MLADVALDWLADGLKVAGAMVWLTFWPLVLGFSLSGLVQGTLARERLRGSLGATTPASTARAAGLGTLSSSCSYAASALARAIFARGSSWSNALVFMVASTNLVIELGVVVVVLLGWPFLLAQLLGGLVMVSLVAMTSRLVLSRSREVALRERVRADTPPEARAHAPATTRERLGDAANRSIGDLAMVRKELLIGFLVAGFVSAHVPTRWWTTIFWHGHGAATVVENVLLAPLVAVLAFVCSVGNVPLAAALWAHGVALGAVVAFLFADLITLPLLAIYRRYYGTATAARLLVALWAAASLAGLAVAGLFDLAHVTPSHHSVPLVEGRFPLGATLVANCAALVLAGTLVVLAHGTTSARVAHDPVCHMSVDVANPGATLRVDGETLFFCSPRCRDRYAAGVHEGDEA